MHLISYHDIHYVPRYLIRYFVLMAEILQFDVSVLYLNYVRCCTTSCYKLLNHSSTCQTINVPTTSLLLPSGSNRPVRGQQPTNWSWPAPVDDSCSRIWHVHQHRQTVHIVGNRAIQCPCHHEIFAWAWQLKALCILWW